MENSKKTVSIDQLDLLNHATAYGLLVRVLEDEDARLSHPKPHPKEIIALFAALFMLPKGLGDALWQASAVSMMDAAKLRVLMPGSKNEVRFPEWDPEDKKNEDCHLLCDIFFMEYAWALLDKKEVDLPDHALGALFTLAGVSMEGIARGYHIDDKNMEGLYGEYKNQFYGTMHTEDKEAAFLQQLDALEALYKAHRNS